MITAHTEESNQHQEALDSLKGFNGKLSQDCWKSLAVAAFPSIGLMVGPPTWLAAALYLCSLAICGAAFAVATYFTFGGKVWSDDDLEDLCDRKDFGHLLGSLILCTAFAAYGFGLVAATINLG